MSRTDQREILEQMAYQFWLERGKPIGSPEVDWHRALTEYERVEPFSGKVSHQEFISAAQEAPGNGGARDEMGTHGDSVAQRGGMKGKRSKEVKVTRDSRAATSIVSSPSSQPKPLKTKVA